MAIYKTFFSKKTEKRIFGKFFQSNVSTPKRRHDTLKNDTQPNNILHSRVSRLMYCSAAPQCMECSAVPQFCIVSQLICRSSERHCAKGRGARLTTLTIRNGTIKFCSQPLKKRLFCGFFKATLKRRSYKKIPTISRE